MSLKFYKTPFHVNKSKLKITFLLVRVEVKLLLRSIRERLEDYARRIL